MGKQLEQNGYEIIDISGAPSLAVNYDGSLRICPWDVGAESIGRYNPNKFISEVQEFVDQGRLDHLCNYCSTVRVKATSNSKK